jgi:hypothetical protein
MNPSANAATRTQLPISNSTTDLKSSIGAAISQTQQLTDAQLYGSPRSAKINSPSAKRQKVNSPNHEFNDSNSSQFALHPPQHIIKALQTIKPSSNLPVITKSTTQLPAYSCNSLPPVLIRDSLLPPQTIHPEYPQCCHELLYRALQLQTDDNTSFDKNVESSASSSSSTQSDEIEKYLQIAHQVFHRPAIWNALNLPIQLLLPNNNNNNNNIDEESSTSTASKRVPTGDAL